MQESGWKASSLTGIKAKGSCATGQQTVSFGRQR